MAKRFDDALKYTAKYRSKLLPCRYCGGNNLNICTGRTIFDPQNVWYIMCEDCLDCSDDYTSVKAAIAHWNSDKYMDKMC